MEEKAAIRPNVWPARQQEHWDDWDQVLWDSTEENHPMVAWWWNQKAVGNTWGAYCYICDRHIVTWARRYPITQRARREVMAHRQWHIEQIQRREKNDDQ